ncbi:HWE histidine kinase domain-containing protein [Aureimonas sp. Leaf324]|jgi:two-component sensor histidine kinase|uniref:sensor histidine kinase n=1 Tax=Aureimonas sp. Leaf324 TaxID=1736336 RepID=UPI0006F58F0E|nr:HWE histidine kinase domain-containing protein [Aureimonas sp. Leaf324]KQQ86235.1 hypothetical protein ASF65_06925 [Aureimonas sp. Leaf324]
MSKLRLVSECSVANVVGDADDHPSDLDLLHAITMDLIGEQDLQTLYVKIVDAAVSIMGSQFGTMQVLREDDDGAERWLELLVSKGLTHEDSQVWERVSLSAHSSCAAALARGQRAIIGDYEEWDRIAGTPDLEAFRRAGIRSAQSTPLHSRDGSLLGMISTHWTEPHVPSERDLRMLDILARQAADLLYRTRAEQELRDREGELRETVATLRETQELQDVLTGELAHRVKNLFAMVTAITSHTMRGSGDQARVQALMQRLMALSSAHDILLRSSWQSALLGDVAAAAINSAGVSGRVRISGPEIAIGSKAALSVALVLHELTTNALKHGSLSVGAGLVNVSWRIEPTENGDVLRLSWRESNGPIVAAPEGKGFGSRLISAGLVGSGDAVVAYNHTGLVCELGATLDRLQGPA